MANQKLTKLDLWKSASAAASEAMEITEPHQLATLKLKKFNDEKQDPKDWGYWQQVFDQQLAVMSSLRTQKAPSAI